MAQRVQNYAVWEASNFGTKLRLWCFMIVHLLGYIALLMADPIDNKMQDKATVNPIWYSPVVCVCVCVCVCAFFGARLCVA
jgi:hypothetical protein